MAILGVGSSGHLCRLPPRRHGDYSRGCSWQGGE